MNSVRTGSFWLFFQYPELDKSCNQKTYLSWRKLGRNTLLFWAIVECCINLNHMSSNHVVFLRHVHYFHKFMTLMKTHGGHYS